jgi:hypothetical protein
MFVCTIGIFRLFNHFPPKKFQNLF